MAPCLFCGSERGDSLVHYSACRVLAVFGRDHLRLPYHVEPGLRRIGFLLLAGSDVMTDSLLTLGALRIAAAYRLHCQFRRRPDALQGREGVRRALEQAVRELVQGHAPAMACYDRRWGSGNQARN